MSDHTKIEWADATVNAVNGCSVLSPGCTNCYAMASGGRNLPNHPSTGLTKLVNGNHVWTGEVRLTEKALLQPLRWKAPRRIFWNAHGDLFHEAVPDRWIDQVFAVCALTPQHQHLILTKRSARMREYVNANRWQNVLDEQYELQAAGRSSEQPVGEAWPLPNVWLGVSVEDQARADQRIPDLLATPTAVRFISAEPLLGPIDLGNVFASMDHHGIYVNDPLILGLDWVIVGGESGNFARPMHPDWAISLRRQCTVARVPFFFKQWGSCLPGDMEGEGEFGEPAYNIDYAAQPVDYDKLGRGRLVIAQGDSFIHFGNKKTGRRLNGREHSEFPA